MIVTYDMIKQSLQSYKAKDMKIKRMSDRGEIVKLTKNLYETDCHVDGFLVANAICSPFYLSFDYALSYHGLIPEAVHVYTSATYKKRKRKEYINALGTFIYRDVPAHSYPYGIELHFLKGYYYAIATPEKAICDKLYTLHPVKNKSEMYELLFENLRIDIDNLKKLDLMTLSLLCDKYASTNMKFLKKVLGELNENDFRRNG